MVVTKQMTYKFGCAIRLMVREIKHPSPQQGDYSANRIYKNHFQICNSPRSSQRNHYDNRSGRFHCQFFNRPTNLLTTYLVYTNKTSVCPLPKYCIVSFIPLRLFAISESYNCLVDNTDYSHVYVILATKLLFLYLWNRDTYCSKSKCNRKICS